MASYTGNLGLKKPALDDDALITDINNNMDILDAAVNGIQDGLAIVANGNTHVAITSGQFVYVRNHGTLTEGMYVASTNIAANATLSTSNLTADSAGGLNALNGNLSSLSEHIAKVTKNEISSVASLEALKTKLTSYNGTISNGESVPVFLNITFTDTNINANIYMGTLYRWDANSLICVLHEITSNRIVLLGKYVDTWYIHYYAKTA